MKERKTKRVEIRITDEDKYILKFLRKNLGLGTYDIVMNAIRNQYFTFVKQAENNYKTLKR